MKPLKGIFSTGIQIKGEFISTAYREDMLYLEKEVVPTDKDQIIVPDGIESCLVKVTVKKIPQNYGKISYNGEYLTVE